MADVVEEATTTSRLLTLSQSDHILTVLREGCKENLPAYKSYIFKKYYLDSLDGTERIIRKCDGKVMVSSAEAPDIIRTTHEQLKHADDKKTWNKLREIYGNISRLAVQEYINKCQKCIADRHVVYQTLFKTTQPDLANRGHVDVIEMPSDGVYRFILHYTLVKTSFCVLRPVRNNSSEEIAFTLHCIFVDFGYPDVLQSHSRKFTSDIIKEVNKLSPQALIISGKYKEEHKRFSLAVKEQLVNWMASNLTTKWTRGLPLVQWEVNNTRRQSTSGTPFQSLFNSKRSSLAISTFKDLQNLPSGVLYEEEIKPFLEFCMPVKQNPTPSATASCLTVCSAASDPKAKFILNKNSEFITIQTSKSSIQAVESFKRKSQSSEPDDSKKLKIIASFSLANSEQVTHKNKEDVSSTILNHNKQQGMLDNYNILEAVDKSVKDIPLETPVGEEVDRICDIQIKTEPMDEPEPPAQIRKQTDVESILFQTKSEPVAISPLPLLQIKEELIIPDT